MFPPYPPQNNFLSTEPSGSSVTGACGGLGTGGSWLGCGLGRPVGCSSALGLWLRLQPPGFLGTYPPIATWALIPSFHHSTPLSGNRDDVLEQRKLGIKICYSSSRPQLKLCTYLLWNAIEGQLQLKFSTGNVTCLQTVCSCRDLVYSQLHQLQLYPLAFKIIFSKENFFISLERLN